MGTGMNTITPGIRRVKLKDAKVTFWVNFVVLTLMLLLMIFIVFLLGPVGLTRKLFALAVCIFGYVLLLIKAYSFWQDEKSRLLKKRGNAKKTPSNSRPGASNPGTAPTSKIDISEMEKLRSGSLGPEFEVDET